MARNHRHKRSFAKRRHRSHRSHPSATYNSRRNQQVYFHPTSSVTPRVTVEDTPTSKSITFQMVPTSSPSRTNSSHTTTRRQRQPIISAQQTINTRGSQHTNHTNHENSATPTTDNRTLRTQGRVDNHLDLLGHEAAPIIDLTCSREGDRSNQSNGSAIRATASVTAPSQFERHLQQRTISERLTSIEKQLHCIIATRRHLPPSVPVIPDLTIYENRLALLSDTIMNLSETVTGIVSQSRTPRPAPRPKEESESTSTTSSSTQSEQTLPHD